MKQINFALKGLQKQLGVPVDGIWGKVSQRAVYDKNAKIKFNASKFSSIYKKLNSKQISGINTILSAINTFDNSEARNPLYTAYMLATAYHETAHTMRPISEIGKGKGRAYGSHIDIDGSTYKNLPHIYYGRGYVQLTWLTNYAKMGKILNIDLVNEPSLALDPTISSQIMIQGMLSGIFTGKSLSDYLKSGKYIEFRHARRIINGNDKADLVALYAMNFLACLYYDV